MKTYIGIDLGGTNIKASVLAVRTISKQKNCFEVLFSQSVPTNAKKGLHAILENLFSLIDSLLEKCNNDYEAIAIASAGDVDSENGRIVYATDNLPGFTGLELQKIVENRYNKPVKIINDAHAALLGEAVSGEAIGVLNAVMLTLGTGVGGAVMIDGKLLNGSRFRGGRLGHMIIKANGRRCNCGQRGCLEQYISATALSRQLKKTSYNSIEELFKANAANEFIEYLSDAIKSIFNVFDTERLIIGGGLVKGADYWFLNLKERLRKDGLEDKVFLSKMVDTCATIGAVSLFLGAEKNGGLI